MSHFFLGYGPFELQDLRQGEEFVASDGSLGVVSRHQVHGPERIEVYLGEKTTTSARVTRHPTMRVFATSREQAKRIERRVQARKRRLRQQHKGVTK